MSWLSDFSQRLYRVLPLGRNTRPALLRSGDVLVYGADTSEPNSWTAFPASGFGGGGDPLTAAPPLDITGTVISILPGDPGDTLQWDGSAWVPAPPTAGAVLSDAPLQGTGVPGDELSLAPPPDPLFPGQTLWWDGAQWVYGGITTVPPLFVNPFLGDTVDIGITPGNADGQVLYWNSGTGSWVAANLEGESPVQFTVGPTGIPRAFLEPAANLDGDVLTTTGGVVMWAAPSPAPVSATPPILGDGTVGDPLRLDDLAAESDVLTFQSGSWVPAALPPAYATTLAPLTGGGTGVGDEVRLASGTSQSQLLYWDGTQWLPGQIQQTGVVSVDNSFPNPPSIGITAGADGEVLVSNGGAAAWDTFNAAPDAYLVAELQAAVLASPDAPQGALTDQTVDFVTAVVFPRLLVSHAGVWFWSLNYTAAVSNTASFANSSGLALTKAALAASTPGFMMYIERMLVCVVNTDGVPAPAPGPPADANDVILQLAWGTEFVQFTLGQLFPGGPGNPVWTNNAVAEVTALGVSPIVRSAAHEVQVTCMNTPPNQEPILDVYVKVSIMPTTMSGIS